MLSRLVRTSMPGCEHIVVSMMDEGVYGKPMKAAGVSVHTLDMPRGRLTFRGMVGLYRLVRSLRPTAIQTWMYHADVVGGVISRLAGHRHVAWGIRHADHDWKRTRVTTRLMIRAGALLSGWVPELIVSCSARATTVHQALGYSRQKFVVIPNGYDLSRFHSNPSLAEPLRREWNVESNTPLIGFVARWNPDKDHANLFRAIKAIATKYPELRCVLVGGGMLKGNIALEHAIRAAGISTRVILAGSREDIPAVMNALDLHVLSSSCEAFPNVVAEAMACGTPCVVTDVGDAAMIVGETGWVVPPGDSEALARAICAASEEMLNNPERWKIRKKECRRRIIENFDIEKMASAYRTLWAQLVDGAGRRNQHGD